MGVGFTAKIRDACICLSKEGAKKEDLGFVPLLHIFAAYNLEEGSVLLEGEGLADGPGRAFDYFMKANVPFIDDLSVRAGYRILEGGYDVNEVYNFTLRHFTSLGMAWEF